MTLYNRVSNTYRHITYIGSIGASSTIGVLCLFLKTPHSTVGHTIWNIAVFKSFFLYDATFVEYLHHAVMLIFLYHNNPYVNTFNITQPDTMYYVRLGYSVFVTSVFSNLQMYLKNSRYENAFRYLNYAFFAVFRFYFNKAIWNPGTITVLKSYYNHDMTKVYVSYSGMFMISLLNAYWTYIMVRNTYRKLTKSR